MVDCSGQIRRRTPRQGPQGFVNMRARCRPLSCFERRPRSSHGPFERLRAPRDNQPVNKLPADAFPYEEIIQLFLEGRRFFFFIRFFIFFMKVRRDGFDDVGNLKPRAVIYMPCTSPQIFG